MCVGGGDGGVGWAGLAIALLLVRVRVWRVAARVWAARAGARGGRGGGLKNCCMTTIKIRQDLQLARNPPY